MNRRPFSLAMRQVVPLPANGSSTRSPGLLQASMIGRPDDQGTSHNGAPLNRRPESPDIGGQAPLRVQLERFAMAHPRGVVVRPLLALRPSVDLAIPIAFSGLGVRNPDGVAGMSNSFPYEAPRQIHVPRRRRQGSLRRGHEKAMGQWPGLRRAEKRAAAERQRLADAPRQNVQAEPKRVFAHRCLGDSGRRFNGAPLCDVP